jgi:hypothetical protein
MARPKRKDNLQTDVELFAEMEILKARFREGIPSTRKNILADLEDGLNSLRNLRELEIDTPGNAETEKLLLDRVRDRMLFIRELEDSEKGKQVAKVKPAQPRLEVDALRQEVCLDGEWYRLSPAGMGMIQALYSAKGAGVGGKEIHPEPHKVKAKLPSKIRAIIQTGRFGYRIDPKYFR